MVGLETLPALRGAAGVGNYPAKFWSPVWDSPWRDVSPCGMRVLSGSRSHWEVQWRW